MYSNRAINPFQCLYQRLYNTDLVDYTNKFFKGFIKDDKL